MTTQEFHLSYDKLCNIGDTGKYKNYFSDFHFANFSSIFENILKNYFCRLTEKDFKEGKKRVKMWIVAEINSNLQIKYYQKVFLKYVYTKPKISYFLQPKEINVNIFKYDF